MPGMPGFEPDPYSLAARATSPPKRGTSVWTTVEELAVDWEAYLAHQRANPVPIGKRGRVTAAPLTCRGFAAHAGVSRSTYYEILKRGDAVGEMLGRIDNAIKDALVSGGLMRFYDSALTARVTGLAEKTESTVNATVDAAPNYDLTVLTDEELEQLSVITAKLEKAIIQ